MGELGDGRPGRGRCRTAGRRCRRGHGEPVVLVLVVVEPVVAPHVLVGARARLVVAVDQVVGPLVAGLHRADRHQQASARCSVVGIASHATTTYAGSSQSSARHGMKTSGRSRGSAWCARWSRARQRVDRAAGRRGAGASAGRRTWIDPLDQREERDERRRDRQLPPGSRHRPRTPGDAPRRAGRPPISQGLGCRQNSAGRRRPG